jgi:hypothetical protein
MKPWFPVKPTWPARLSRFLVRRLQRRLNHFFHTYLDGITPLRVDGKIGRLTQNRIRLAKSYLGQVGQHSTKVNRLFMKRLKAPNSLRLADREHVERGKANRRKHDKLYHESQSHYSGKPHWITYDGKMLAAYLGPINDWARHTGAIINGRLVKWKGQVVSGGRTAAYSIHLCEMMCGAPSCPGRCAGASTNHVGNDPHATPTGAEDVSDYVTFGLLMQHCPFEKLGTVPVHNALPNDRVHFSPRGN